jgi:alkyl hydroperoxide reductase subunit AhpC
MAIRIGDEAPDFTAETTEGKIRFHEWIGDKWRPVRIPKPGMHHRD